MKNLFRRSNKAMALFMATAMVMSTFMTAMGGFMPSFAEEGSSANAVGKYAIINFSAIGANNVGDAAGSTGFATVDMVIYKATKDSSGNYVKNDVYANLSYDNSKSKWLATGDSNLNLNLNDTNGIKVLAGTAESPKYYIVTLADSLPVVDYHHNTYANFYVDDTKVVIDNFAHQAGSGLNEGTVAYKLDGEFVGDINLKVTQALGIKLIKQDKNGKPLQGVKFKLTGVGGSDHGTYVTDEKGVLVNTNDDRDTNANDYGKSFPINTNNIFSLYTYVGGSSDSAYKYTLEETEDITNVDKHENFKPIKIQFYQLRYAVENLDNPFTFLQYDDSSKSYKALKNQVDDTTGEGSVTVSAPEYFYGSGDYNRNVTKFPLYTITAKNNVTKKVDKKGELKVVKKDNVTNTTIAGAGFTLTKGTLANDTFTPDSPSVTKSAVTTASGEISFTDLEDGVYKLEETKVPTGYDVSKPSVAYVEVKGAAARLLETPAPAYMANVADTSILTLTAKNTPVEKSSSVYLYKKDKDTNAPLSGVEFSIYKVDEKFGRIGDVIRKITTDANGKTEKISLNAGSYEIYESKAPAGYSSTSKGYFNVDAKGDVSLMTNPAAVNLDLGKDNDGVSYFTAVNIKDNVPGPDPKPDPKPDPTPDTVINNNPGGNTAIAEDNTQNDELNDGNNEVNADDKPIGGGDEEENSFNKALPQTGGFVDANLLYALGAAFIAIGAVVATRKKISE